MVSSADEKLIWALNLNKDTSSLTDINPDFIFIDTSGKPYSRQGVEFRIVRSGKRNMLGAPVAAITLMTNPVDATTHKLAFTMDSKIINATAVEYKEKWQTDNDVFQKYMEVTDPVTCAVTEVESCSGYLDKSINPYCKGLIGNFRSYRNLVFYGGRIEADPASTTNLLQNGFLTGFNPYWDFDTDKNLVPDISNTKWVWNVQSTKFNSKGMELETKDALNIYTAAQYGYNKTLPVSIANNSRYGEMAYEGFEDYEYNDLLNNAQYNNCRERYIDFTGLDSAQVVNADQSGFNAHSGKYVLGVTGQVTKSFKVGDVEDADFPLEFSSETLGALNDPGGNITDTFTWPTATIWGFDPTYLASHYTINGGSSIRLFVTPTDTCIYGDESRQHVFDISSDHYLDVTTTGTYPISISYVAISGSEKATYDIEIDIRIWIPDINFNIIRC